MIMKLPSFGWKAHIAVLSVVFFAGGFIGQWCFRAVMQTEDANTITAYFVASKLNWDGVAASIRQSNELKFSANGWKVLDGGMQIAQAPKP
jgi:hypothetical protein